MAYKELKNFQDIFGRKDFSYISEPTNIDKVSKIILAKLANPDGNEENYIVTINCFMNNLNSFFGWLNCEAIGDIMEGCKVSQEILSKIIVFFKQPSDKRAAISRARLLKRPHGL